MSYRVSGLGAGHRIRRTIQRYSFAATAISALLLGYSGPSYVFAQAVTAQPQAAVAVPSALDGPAYRVTSFEPNFETAFDGAPTTDELKQIQVELGKTEKGWVAPRDESGAVRPGVELVTVTLAGWSEPQMLHASAIKQVTASIVRFMNQRGVYGVLVFPDDKDIQLVRDGTGRDLRPAGQAALRLVVRCAPVKQVRTVATAAEGGSKINSDGHSRIAANSPVKQDGVLRADLLDDYILRLNRHPGRRVDVAIAAAEQGATLDYLVSEAKPWTAYAQVTNTGTRQTDEWRERFGFIHNQLTNNDDILSLNYTTTGFDTSHSFIGSYEAPLGDSDRLRWRILGNWGQFTASEVGFANERFEGEEWSAGGDLVYNLYQHRELFVDLIGGVRWRNIEVTNELLPGTVNTDFFLPRIGVGLERTTQTATTLASINYETNISEIADTARVASSANESIQTLGRENPDRNYDVLSWDFSQTFFLEPLLNPQAWSQLDPTDPSKSSEWAQLAHEIALSFRGQYSFGQRLIPQAMDAAGGFYSVRGYPESIVVGDAMLIGSAEYRFHFPNSLFPGSPDKLFGHDFAWRPSRFYGRADWDLIFRAFVDVAQAYVEDPKSYESDQTLVGTGVGLELVIKQNFSARADWGVALKEVNSGQPDEVTVGSNRFHLAFTLTY